MASIRRLHHLQSWFHRGLKALDRVKPLPPPSGPGPWSDVPVSLVIPLHPKDLAVAEHALRHARHHVCHPIEECLILAPPDDRARRFADRHECRFVDENEALGVSLPEVEERLARHGFPRSGWIYQQLLKLGCDQHLKTDHALILDADTLLLRPRVFFDGATLFQDLSHERNHLYRKAHRMLMGTRIRCPFSFVCHHMFLEKRILQSLRQTIEDRTAQSWWEAILALADPALWTETELRSLPFNFFSEYETYANFSLPFYQKVRFRYFMNHGARDFDPAMRNIPWYVKNLPSRYQWASFHSYYREQRGAAEAPEETLSSTAATAATAATAGENRSGMLAGLR